MAQEPTVQEPRKPWRKILYQDQGVPDNYIDESFLTEMKKNLYVRHYTYSQLVKDSSLITQQISSAILFLMSFNFLTSDLSCLNMNCAALIVTLLLTVTLKVSGKIGLPISLETVFTFYLTSLAFSPLLRTLTDTISTDTIYAMAAISLVVHLFLHDYPSTSIEKPPVVSFNAAVFATVCLASRFDTNAHAFGLTMIAVNIFATWPPLRKAVRQNNGLVDLFLTIVLNISAIVSLAIVNVPLAVLLTALLGFISFICPYWLLSLQGLKNTIHGPWDEAVVTK